MRHPRPRLSQYSRCVLVRMVVEDSWPQARVAELLQVSRTTVAKWVRRYRLEGADGLADRSSRPHNCPRRTAATTEALVLDERRRLRSGPDDLAARLGLAPVTVCRVLRRHGCSRLADYAGPIRSRFDTSASVQVSWSISTSRRSAEYPTAEAGTYVVWPACSSTSTSNHPEAATTFTLRSTMPRDWLLLRSSPTSV